MTEKVSPLVHDRAAYAGGLSTPVSAASGRRTTSALYCDIDSRMLSLESHGDIDSTMLSLESHGAAGVSSGRCADTGVCIGVEVGVGIGVEIGVSVGVEAGIGICVEAGLGTDTGAYGLMIFASGGTRSPVTSHR